MFIIVKGMTTPWRPFRTLSYSPLSLNIVLVDDISLCPNFQWVYYIGNSLWYYMHLLQYMCV